MSDVFSYRNLRVYQQAKEFVVYVYRLLKQFPKEEQYALCDQLRRAVISIPSNIAEGRRDMKASVATVKTSVSLRSLPPHKNGVLL